MAEVYTLPTPTPQYITEQEVRALIGTSFTNFSETARVQRGYWKSGNFVTGTTGWTINADGSAEFSNIVARGSITATSGAIGGWTITTGYIYDLVSGTPSASPNDGLVMDSGNAAFIVYEDTVERVRMGYLSAGVYGILGYATNGSTKIFELSDTQQMIAGWAFTDASFYNLVSGTPTSSPNDGLVLTANATPAVIIYEDTAKRAEMGYLSAGVFGFKAYATDGTTAIFEMSDTQQMIAGWNFTNLVLRTGSTDANSNVLIDSANSLMRLGPTTGNYLTMDGANLRVRSSNYVSGNFGAGFTLEPDLLEVGNISARGIFRASVFVKASIAAVGGSVAILPADKLNATMTALDSATLTISGNETFAVNDRLRIKSDGQDEWFIVTNIASAPTYTVTRDAAAAYAADTNPAWTTGAVAVNYGASGTGGVYITSTDTNSPYLDVFTHAGSPWTTITTRARLGNLAGITDAVFGALTGFGLWTDNIYLTGSIMATAGRIGSSTNYWNITAGSLAAVGAGNVEIRAGQTAYNTGTGFWLGLDAGTPKFSIGVGGGTNSVTFDGTLFSGNFNVSQITQTSTTGSGLRVSRNLAAASTDSPLVEFVNDNVADDQVALRIQQDCDANVLALVGANTSSSGVYGLFASMTSGSGFISESSSLTTGRLYYGYSNSADTSTRNLAEIVNDNTLATGAVCLRLQQDANANSIRIDGLNTTSSCMYAVLNSMTEGVGVYVEASALTTGRLYYGYSNSADTSVRTLSLIVNDNVAANRAIPFRTQQDAHWFGVEVDGFTSFDDAYMTAFPAFLGGPNDGLAASGMARNPVDTTCATTSVATLVSNVITSVGTWSDDFVIVFPGVVITDAVAQNAFFGLADAGGGDFTTGNVPNDATSTNRHIGFFVDDATAYISNADGTTQTRTDVSATWVEQTETTLAIWVRSGTDIVFLMRTRAATAWTVLGTHTTNMPSGTTGPPDMFIGIESTDAGTRELSFGNNYFVATQ